MDTGDKIMVWGDYLSFEHGKPMKYSDSADGDVPVFGANGQIGTSRLPPLCRIPSFIIGRKGTSRGVHYSSVPFSVNDAAFYALPLTDKVDLKWAYFKFLTYQIHRIGRGSFVPSTNRNELYQIPVDLPPIETQRRVVAVLEAVEKQIQINTEINGNLLRQAQTLYKARCIDLIPFGGSVPTGWHQGTTSEVLEFHDSRRSPLSSRDRASLAKVYPYYGAASILDYVDRYLFDGIYLLMGEDGTVTDCAGYPILQYVEGKFWVNNHAHILSGQNGFSVELLYLLLSQTNVASVVTGGVQPKISQANLKKVPILIPSGEELDLMDRQIQPIFIHIRNLMAENNRLTAIHETLLPKLMSGEVDVSRVVL